MADGRLELDAPAPVPEWRGTAKEAITLQDLLDMRPGLEWVEDYVDDSISHCIDMLFGSGQDDMAAYAAALPLIHAPGSTWNYSSGTTNIVCRIIGDVVGGGREGVEQFLHERLFEPAGMHSAIPKFDTSGTFIGSSYVYATARDFAKFGELYRNDGVVHGHRVLPAGWSDHARRVRRQRRGRVRLRQSLVAVARPAGQPGVPWLRGSVLRRRSLEGTGRRASRQVPRRHARGADEPVASGRQQFRRRRVVAAQPLTKSVTSARAKNADASSGVQLVLIAVIN